MSQSSLAPSTTDRVERHIHIRAPRSRVWRALANAEEFGKWFGANLQGQALVPGGHVKGQMTMPGHEHVVFDALIEKVEPETLLSYRWHPYAVDPVVDYSQEPRTLVTFTLQDSADGTLLTVLETGFDELPPARRLEAFPRHDAGWEFQLGNIQRHAVSA